MPNTMEAQDAKADPSLKKQKVIIFIGQEGAGKTTLARQVAETTGASFFDGDDAINKNSWMATFVKYGLPVWPPQAKDFIENKLLPAVRAQAKLAQKAGRDLIVAQSIFTNDHRELFHQEFDCEFVFVNTAREVQKQNLANRDYSFNWRLFSYFNNRFFEKPDAPRPIPLTHRIQSFLAKFGFPAPAKIEERHFKFYVIQNKGKDFPAENARELVKLPFYQAALEKRSQVTQVSDAKQVQKSATLPSRSAVSSIMAKTTVSSTPITQLFSLPRPREVPELNASAATSSYKPY